MRSVFFGVLAVAALTLAAHRPAAAQATTSANASATIVTAISLSKTSDLNFGNVVASGSTGTVVLTAGGARSVTGGASLGNTGSTAAASFTVSGQASATYSITLPSSTTITSGGNSMTVNTFSSSPSGTGALSGGGSQTLNVGATLQVGASQATGSYTGTFDVTVAYN
jgi:spore coat protein U-like protein